VLLVAVEHGLRLVVLAAGDVGVRGSSKAGKGTGETFLAASRLEEAS